MVADNGSNPQYLSDQVHVLVFRAGLPLVLSTENPLTVSSVEVQDLAANTCTFVITQMPICLKGYAGE